MRTIQRFYACTLVFLLIGGTSAAAQLPSNDLEGTWRMESQTLVYPDTVVDRSGNWGANYKILNSTHFAWGRETEDGESVLAGGGRYEYDPEKNLYVEHIQYHSDPALSGETLRFEARVEGDTWYHIGQVGDHKLREVWKRVDPKQVRAELRGDTSAAEETADPGSQ